MRANNQARFAVVGHPNKGKSSIVSTLSQNDDVVISSRSGTTEKAEGISITTANGGYQLIDTPGFQRPVKVLRWLKEQGANASERAKVLAKFVNDSQCRQQYPDEVELLRPIVEGAAILYVVDGSHPYGAEYEAEMEVLRWSGQPSMALINPIESVEYIKEWENALLQYFKSVQVFNPMKADFEKQITLLKTFSYLNPVWTEGLDKTIADLLQQRKQQLNQSIALLSRLVEDLCQHRESQKVLTTQQAQKIKPLLEKQYQHWMRERELQSVKELMAIYGHFQSDVITDQIDLPPDLFDCDQWFAWGLDKRQLVYAATATGALGGAALDVAVAGSSFMLGALGGGLIGASSAWFGADKLADMSVQGLPVGGYEARFGPMKNRNFPYVVIGRFVHLHAQISQRSHASREALSIDANDFQQRVQSLEKSTQRELHQECERLIKQRPTDDLESALRPLFEKN
ncbi:GTPase/DUF3482 domain-containing protein [Alteromonas sp. ASW11-130]|uniref:GTPase/DUF3482 domain-containing protein n=1 Tax=Alteromonas sp. ASW11-130 TaxID=3015775 RepID=UPI002241F0C7|nr:GTPase/DUF3482 domain-containing protein [Alteromonas sp. ASW11-130]MCW8091757.1 GTPase/DUF3482 domain-containing protein [Alteromonas sp. ASW11-130]